MNSRAEEIPDLTPPKDAALDTEDEATPSFNNTISVLGDLSIIQEIGQN